MVGSSGALCPESNSGGQNGQYFFFPQDDEFGVPEQCQHTDWGVTEIVYVNRHPIKIFVPTHPRGMALIIS